MSRPAATAAVAAALIVSLSGCGSSDDDVPVGPDGFRAYDESQAVFHAHLATAASCGKSSLGHDRALETWSCGPACDAVPDMRQVRIIETDHWDDAYAYVGRLGSDCVLSFRGTSQLAGWIKDLESGAKANLKDYGIACSFAGKPCRVGRGFVMNYARLAENIRGNMSEIGCDARPLIVTGHSLGAAEASIAMLDLHNRGYTVKETYVFGNPRVGDSAFSGAFNETFSSRHVFSLTHYKDPVPHLPPTFFGFQHLPTEVYYGQGNTSAGFIVCDGSSEDPACSGQWGNEPAMIASCISGEAFHSNCDHLMYLEGALGHRMSGSACVDGSQAAASSSPLSI